MSGANVELFYTNDAKGDYYKYLERRKLLSNQKQLGAPIALPKKRTEFQLLVDRMPFCFL